MPKRTSKHGGDASPAKVGRFDKHIEVRYRCNLEKYKVDIKPVQPPQLSWHQTKKSNKKMKQTGVADYIEIQIARREFLRAARMGNLKSLRKVLAKRDYVRLDLDAVDDMQESALTLAWANGHHRVIRMLEANGANMNRGNLLEVISRHDTETACNLVKYLKIDVGYPELTLAIKEDTPDVFVALAMVKPKLWHVKIGAVIKRSNKLGPCRMLMDSLNPDGVPVDKQTMSALFAAFKTFSDSPIVLPDDKENQPVKKEQNVGRVTRSQVKKYVLNDSSSSSDSSSSDSSSSESSSSDSDISTDYAAFLAKNKTLALKRGSRTNILGDNKSSNSEVKEVDKDSDEEAQDVYEMQNRLKARATMLFFGLKFHCLTFAEAACTNNTSFITYSGSMTDLGHFALLVELIAKDNDDMLSVLEHLVGYYSRENADMLTKTCSAKQYNYVMNTTNGYSTAYNPDRIDCYSPLMAAIVGNKPQCVKMLLAAANEAGVDITDEVKGKIDSKPVPDHKPTEPRLKTVPFEHVGLLWMAVVEGNSDIVRQLLLHGVCLSSATVAHNNDMFSITAIAIYQDNDDVLRHILGLPLVPDENVKGPRPDDTLSGRRTALSYDNLLHYAIKRGRKATVRSLVQSGLCLKPEQYFSRDHKDFVDILGQPLGLKDQCRIAVRRRLRRHKRFSRYTFKRLLSMANLVDQLGLPTQLIDYLLMYV